MGPLTDPATFEVEGIECGMEICRDNADDRLWEHVAKKGDTQTLGLHFIMASGVPEIKPYSTPTKKGGITLLADAIAHEYLRSQALEVKKERQGMSAEKALPEAESTEYKKTTFCETQKPSTKTTGDDLNVFKDLFSVPTKTETTAAPKQDLLEKNES